jgi:nuclear GTP-binding protein
MKRIYLIDCPGIVPPSTTDTDTDLVLKGVVRIENVKEPEEHVQAVLNRCDPVHLSNAYNGLTGWSNAEEFLEGLARQAGRLLKGGEPDVRAAAKMVLNDWLRGKIPYHTKPPADDKDEVGEGGGAEAAVTSTEATPSLSIE